MSSSILVTKLHIPTTRSGLVPRPRLKEQIEQGLRGPLTLITAPAGFGKTTLVASSITSSRRPVAWLSLDKNDNQEGRFLSYLVAALQEIDHKIGSEGAQLMATPKQAQSEAILISLINDLDRANTEIILVLDDYQYISSQAVHDEMTFILEHCPNTLHMVIATRSDPPLPLARLRARGQMAELRAADLRFTESEATHFLNEVMGLDLDAKAVAVLEKRTEGWVAGLQMAALSMRDRKDLHGFIEGFSGTNRYILDYLLEEVLANQTPEIQRFLLNTSILERLTAPLCDFLLGMDKTPEFGDARVPLSISLTNHQSAAVLEYLERVNLFLVPLDDERRWYRYHHLFADLLHTRLQQTHSSEEVNRLHTRAAQWYEQNGYAYEAIHYASLTSNNEWVERLIEQNYMEMFQRKDSASIRAWTGELSKDLILKSPKLSIHEAMSRSWHGELAEADLLLKEAKKCLLAEASTSETQALLGHLAYVQSRVTAMRGDFHQAIQLGLTARESTPPSNQALLGGIGVMLGYGYFLDGDFENAAQTLTETIHSGVASGAVNTTIGAYCVLARLYALRGQLHRSYELYQAAEKFAYDMGGRHRGALSIIDVGFANVFYEKNDLETAITHVKQGLEFIHLWGKADDIALAHTIHSLIQQAQGNTTGALESIEKGSQVIRTSGIFSEAREAVVTAEIRLRLAQGDSLAVSTWMNAHEKNLHTENSFRFENELAHLTLVQIYLAQKRLGEAEELLSRLEANAQSSGRVGRLIQMIILKALTMHRMGDIEHAVVALTKGLALSEPEGFLRFFLDEGQPMRVLLALWLSYSNSSSLRYFAIHLLSQFDSKSDSVSAVPEKASPTRDLLEPLSPRELEVLDLIALGNTNKEIAQQLIVAPGTVKAHTASIYRKLNVANRTEAVARARQLGMLS